MRLQHDKQMHGGNAMISRRGLLLSGAVLLLDKAARASTNYVVGAIRWDAWGAAGQPGGATGVVNAAVRSTLGPSQWQSRMPWFGVPTSPYTVSIAGNQQATMDAEIVYAKSAGLNYWAYCWYGPTDPMMQSWARHQSSSVANNMNWCLLLQFSRLGGASGMSAVQSAFVGYMQQTNYQKVLSGRPLIYLFMDDLTHLASDWGGSYANVQTSLNALRNACTSAGLANPYIVIMYGTPMTAYSIMGSVSADAISNYTAPSAPGQPAAYSAQITSDAAFWATMAATGASIVPIVQTGWDTRPRKQNPPYFAKQPPGAGMLNYVAAGTPTQVASDFQAAITYVGSNPAACPSKAILAYSWDECDEGGSALIPTYTSGGPNHAILDAVGLVLNAN
jgi:hypothetical protein